MTCSGIGNSCFDMSRYKRRLLKKTFLRRLLFFIFRRTSISLEKVENGFRCSFIQFEMKRYSK